MRLLAGGFDDGLASGDVDAQRFLAQDVFVGLNGTDGLRCVLSSDACNADGFETGVLQHLVEVLVDLGAIWGEVCCSPGSCIGIWVASSNQLGTRSLLEKVAGVASTHAAEARDGDLELANHCACWSRGGGGRVFTRNRREGYREDVP